MDEQYETAPEASEERFRAQAARMVDLQIARRGVRDPRVLEAMRSVPRHRFVEPEQLDLAYEDQPLPIGSGQTISQPFIVAHMAEAASIQSGDRVLEVGTGSGYSAAVLSRLCAQLFTIERHAALADAARERLAQLGYDNVVVGHGDGARGWTEHAPYDAIVVTAAASGFPRALAEQLAPGGRLVVPVAGESADFQELLRIERTADGLKQQRLGAVRFVPLVVEH